VFFGRSGESPFKSRQEMMRSPDFAKVVRYAQERMRASSDVSRHYQYLIARDELMINFLKVMADNKLDTIVYKSIEHQPTLIQRRHEPALREYEGCPLFKHFSGVRSRDRSPGRIYKRQPARWHHVHGKTVRRRNTDQAGLFIRASDAPS